MKASIIIPTKDKNSRLILVLQALEPQMGDEEEVIIVFDGCSRSTLDEFDRMDLRFSPVKIVCENNIGRAAARNVGIKKAQGRIVIFLDDDRIPCHDFISRHIEGHWKECVLLGERKDVLLTEDEIEEMSNTGVLRSGASILEAKLLRKKVTSEIPIIHGSPLNWLNFFTGNISVERECLNKVGGFDENFKGWGHEDIELGIRLYKEGIKYKRDKKAINYHILHDSNFVDKREESLKNLKYMIHKYKEDFFLCSLLKLLYIKHKLTGLNKYYSLKDKNTFKS